MLLSDVEARASRARQRPSRGAALTTSQLLEALCFGVWEQHQLVSLRLTRQASRRKRAETYDLSSQPTRGCRKEVMDQIAVSIT